MYGYVILTQIRVSALRIGISTIHVLVPVALIERFRMNKQTSKQMNERMMDGWMDELQQHASKF